MAARFGHSSLCVLSRALSLSKGGPTRNQGQPFDRLRARNVDSALRQAQGTTRQAQGTTRQAQGTNPDRLGGRSGGSFLFLFLAHALHEEALDGLLLFLLALALDEVALHGRLLILRVPLHGRRVDR